MHSGCPPLTSQRTTAVRRRQCRGRGCEKIPALPWCGSEPRAPACAPANVRRGAPSPVSRRHGSHDPSVFLARSPRRGHCIGHDRKDVPGPKILAHQCAIIPIALSGCALPRNRCLAGNLCEPVAAATALPKWNRSTARPWPCRVRTEANNSRLSSRLFCRVAGS